MGETNRTPEFLALNPLGKVPVLETPEGGIFESNAIARYVGGLRADTQLLGASYFEQGQVSMWMDFVTTHVDLPVSNWVYQILGWMQFNKGITVKAQQDVLAALKIVDDHLLKNSFLVGSNITLADITLVCSLDLAYRMVFDPKYRANFPNVTRWFATCVNQPEFVAIMGPVELCAKMQEAKAPAKPKAEKKKKEKKPSQEPKKKKEQGGGGAAPAPAPAKKAKNPLDLLPKSSMVLDEWKRQYSNLDTVGEGSACEWLWKNFDSEGYSWWHLKNKYSDEQEKSWMAANLVGGFANRWEGCRKYSFGVVLICGEDKPGGMILECASFLLASPFTQFQELNPAILWQGLHDVPRQGDHPGIPRHPGKCPPKLSVWMPLLNPPAPSHARVFVQDVETYDVSPIDPVNDMAVRKRLEAFLSWGEFGTEAELPGPCLDGKEFK